MIFDQYATLALSAAVPAHLERSPVSSAETRLGLADAALSVLEDFRQHPPVSLSDRLSVEDAMALFRALPLRHLVVEGSQGDFQGILTADSVLGPRRMVQMRLHQLLPHELSVRDLMISRNRLLSVPYASLANARVGDVLTTLEVCGQGFLCVTEGALPSEGRLRGLFCARDIGESLGLPWSPPLRAQSFSELRATLLDQADLAV